MINAKWVWIFRVQAFVSVWETETNDKNALHVKGEFSEELSRILVPWKRKLGGTFDGNMCWCWKSKKYREDETYKLFFNKHRWLPLDLSLFLQFWCSECFYPLFTGDFFKKFVGKCYYWNRSRSLAIKSCKRMVFVITGIFWLRGCKRIFCFNKGFSAATLTSLLSKALWKIRVPLTVAKLMQVYFRKVLGQGFPNFFARNPP